jgi:small ligand-binding sensory domain FIST
MRWASASANGSDFDASIAKVGTEVEKGLAGDRAQIAFLFVGPALAPKAGTALERVRAALGPVPVVGCTAGGVIGGGREREQPGAIALMAGSLPGVEVRTFHVEDDALPDADAPPSAWHRLVGAAPGASPCFAVVADPYSVRAALLLQGLDLAYPGAVKVGGLASGASGPGEQVLFAGDRAVRSGAVGVALSGDVAMTPAVAQGCRGIGPVFRITACEGGSLARLDGEPALAAVRRVLQEACERDRNLARSSALFLGIETDPFGDGGADGPWLVRNIVGIDAAEQALQIGESLRPGRRVRFHVRDRVSSAEDLERTLEAASHAPGPSASGALLFSCLGRGMHLYGVPDHDTRAFHAHFEGLPLGGFFCSGEIGPVGHETRLHGYTSSFGILRPARAR